ncbi:charged multivesicular body protein 7 [Diorhabda carinulata]|uniref:charged multivesicular body protein 7 n=1 Tax=Diorhabda carinulata TaxID=1163345 RepID=UPI0025A2198E|nr:charged multivesicular body protein 7 [Diorhabda carinulata]
MFDIPNENLPDCLLDENRINVLFAPIRNKSVNPKDWDNKISSWKTIIKTYCESNDIYTFTVSSLSKVFIRNGRSPPCLPEVISEMEKNGDIQRLDLFLKNNPKTWTGWATDIFVKTPFVWSFNKLKSSLFTTDSSQQPKVFIEIIKTKCDTILKILPNNYKNKLISLKDLLSIIKKTPNDIEDVKLLLHHMSNKNIIDITKLNSNNKNELETTLIKFSDTNSTISEVDVGVYTLEQNEKIILKGIEEMEDNIEKLIKEAKVHLSKHHRQMAKSCLRKKHDLEKSLEKKAQALHNVQLLLHQINEANSNATVWDSYKKVLTTFDVTYKDAGISEDLIDDTMIKLGEVLDKNEDIQSALSKPPQDFDDTDLEQELADLINEDNLEGGPPDGGVNTSEIEMKLDDLSLNLPEVPDNSPEKSREVDLGSSQL